MNLRLVKTLALGVGSALIAMAIYPILAKAAKPVLKNIVKGGLELQEKTKLVMAEGKEKIEDLVAEVKEEMEEDTNTQEKC